MKRLSGRDLRGGALLVDGPFRDFQVFRSVLPVPEACDGSLGWLQAGMGTPVVA
jgi:hypothetical protein